jgi:hypothetical protein
LATRLPLLAITLIALIAIAGLSYALVIGVVNGSHTPKVTWQESGTTIASLDLTFTAPGSTSQTITFTCNPGTGPVTLKLSSSLESIITLSQTDFPSCNSTPNAVTLTATSSTSLNVGGTLHLTQPYTYRTLAAPLQVTVQAK